MYTLIIQITILLDFNWLGVFTNNCQIYSQFTLSILSFSFKLLIITVKKPLFSCSYFRYMFVIVRQKKNNS